MTPAALSTRGRGYSPDQLASAYDIAPLHTLGIGGQGQTVAVVSYHTFDARDTGAFSGYYGLPGPAVERVPIAGGGIRAAKPQDDFNQEMEVDLDLDMIKEIAPGAQVISYKAPNSGKVSQGDIINRIVKDRRASVISDSWGSCEERLLDSRGGRALIRSDFATLAMAARTGHTISSRAETPALTAATTEIPKTTACPSIGRRRVRASSP